MKIIWLGQSGLLFVSGNKKIVVDPYLSDSLKKENKKMARGMKLNRKFFRVKPDIIVLTNSHPDHTDIATLTSYLHKAKSPITLLCSESSYSKVQDAGIKGRYKTVMFCEGSEWTLDNLRITAVKAQTDDKNAIGITISDSLTGKIYYVASDTLYNKYVIDSVPPSPDVSFVPINGDGGCMNMVDAARFACAIDSQITVPIHFGMFDKTDPWDFPARRKMIPKIYNILDFENMECIRRMFKKSKGLTHKFEEQKPKKSKGKEADGSAKTNELSDNTDDTRYLGVTDAAPEGNVDFSQGESVIGATDTYENTGYSSGSDDEAASTSNDGDSGFDSENNFADSEDAEAEAEQVNESEPSGYERESADDMSDENDGEKDVSEKSGGGHVVINDYVEAALNDPSADDFSEDDINEENLSEKIDAYIKEPEKSKC